MMNLNAFGTLFQETSMRVSSTVTFLFAVASVVGCASGAPTVDLEPVAAAPDSPGLHWFAENWGPFDETMSEPDEDGSYPLMLVDGVQVPRGSEVLRSITEEMIDPDHPDNVQIRVFKHRCDKEMFGPAARGGIIMIFTHGYDGPIPDARAGHPLGTANPHPRNEVCHSYAPSRAWPPEYS
jgi:hypothetical protein